MPTRQQAIIWTNDGIVYWCIYVSLSLNELMESPHINSLWLSHDLSGLEISGNFHLPDFQNFAVFNTHYIWFRRKICTNLLTWLTGLLAPGRLAVGYVKPCIWYQYIIFNTYSANALVLSHWFGQWLVTWWHQAITQINVDLSSVGFYGIHMKVISHKTAQYISIPKINLKSIMSLSGQWVNGSLILC